MGWCWKNTRAFCWWLSCDWGLLVGLVGFVGFVGFVVVVVVVVVILSWGTWLWPKHLIWDLYKNLHKNIWMKPRTGKIIHRFGLEPLWPPKTESLDTLEVERLYLLKVFSARTIVLVRVLQSTIPEDYHITNQPKLNPRGAAATLNPGWHNIPWNPYCFMMGSQNVTGQYHNPTAKGFLY